MVFLACFVDSANNVASVSIHSDKAQHHQDSNVENMEQEAARNVHMSAKKKSRKGIGISCPIRPS